MFSCIVLNHKSYGICRYGYSLSCSTSEWYLDVPQGALCIEVMLFLIIHLIGAARVRTTTSGLSGLLYDHFDGIIAYAAHRISSVMIEGLNNKIKTFRIQGYGFLNNE